MPKIKVHELARELNMTNKMLLERLQSMDLPEPVTHHMNTLDEDVADFIKGQILRKKDEALEEKRVTTGVIRRRRVPRSEEAQAEESLAAPSPEEALEAPAGRPEQAAGPLAEGGEAPPEAPAPAEAPGEIPEEAEKPLRKKARMEAEAAASIVKPAPVPEPETAPEPAPEPVRAEEPAPPGEPPAPEAPGGEPVAAEAVGEAVAAEASAEEAEAGEKPSEEDDKTGKGRKKRKRDTPAKIISLPERPVAPAPPPEARGRQTDARGRQAEVRGRQTYVPPPAPGAPGIPPAAALPAPDSDKAGKRKKKNVKKKVEEPAEVDSRFFKKKISFRKKEVVEGAALYDQAAGRHRKGKKGQKPLRQQTLATTPKAIKRRVKVDEAILVSDLAKRMGVKSAELIKKLIGMGIMATVNQALDYDTAALLATEFGYETEHASFEEEAIVKRVEDVPENLAHRPPVVTIMGHVDHGKTSLLDAVRQTRVTDQEAGGITQHIGAYVVDIERGRVVFLDTPGHEAFTAMRARGAQITDIVVLVVAADDGVMPQTVEAINHAQAAGVPIIVAVNKIDKANADPERVMRELSDKGLVPEAWGGTTIFSFVSAKKKEGIEGLLEMILLQAEVLELKADPDKLARGHVVEARMDPGRGPVATVLVQEGTLRAGDAVVCGVQQGKIRAMMNEKGEQMDSAGPSIPVEILGLSGVPMAGDEMVAVENEKVARQVSSSRMEKQRNLELVKTSRRSLENLFEQMKQGEIKDLNLIIKADVQGSIEALRESLEKLSGEEVHINVIHSGTGAVSESDVALASVSDAIIISFNVRPNAKVAEMAVAEHVDIRYYDIIYNMINDIKAAVLGLMASTFEERVTGRAEVRDVFTIPKVGTIAGSYVTDGKVERGSRARVVRDGTVAYDGKIGSLRRFKDDVKEVATGYECGISIENFNDIKVGDIIEFYHMEEIKPTMA